MKLSPWILGAVVAVPVAGAVIGSQVSTDPVGVRSDVIDTLPIGNSVVHAATAAKPQPRQPDHYAMETPEGIVEVHELALRGRYQNRYRDLQREESYQAEYGYEDDIAALEARWDGYALDARAERALSSANAAEVQPTARHYAAMEQARTGENVDSGVTQVADGVIEIASPHPQIGNARMINVASEVASLN